MKVVFALLALLVAGGAAFAAFTGIVISVGDTTSNVLPAYSDAYANWSKSGLSALGTTIAAIDAGRSICNVTPLAPSGGDDTVALNSLIAGCAAGTIVQLAAGTFSLASNDNNQSIFIGKSVTVRGSGNCTNGSSPYCNTVLNVTNGASAATYNAGSGNCVGTCNENAIFYMAPVKYVNLNSPNTWGTCAYDTPPSSCGNVALDADAAQGQTSVQVHATATFSVGMFVRIDEASAATTYTGPLGSSIFADPNLLASSGSPANGKIAYAGAGVENGYGAMYDRETSEIKLISAIGPGPCPGASCTLTFDTPLTIAYRQSGSHNAYVYPPNNPFLQKAGIENMTLKGATGSPVIMVFCAYCWMQKIETAYWLDGVSLSNSIRDQITSSYFHDCGDCENNGAEYPLAIDGATTETLVDNNIIRLGGKGMVGRACGGGNVVAYNYVDDTFYQANVIGNYWLDMGINGSHYTGCHHALFEGNWGDNCDNDDTHGNIMYHTFFSNWCTGLRSDFNDPSLALSTSVTYNPSDAPVSDVSNIGFATFNPYPYVPGEQHAAGMMAENYWHSFVGNVLGSPGVTCSSSCASTGWVYQSAGQNNHTMWMLGWVGAGPNDPYLTGATASYYFRHANYDAYNNAIVDYQTGYSHTLPNSFYLAGAPSYFGASGTHCTYSWPWVTATGGSPIQTPTGGSCAASTSGDGLPAKARFDAGTPFVQP